jgi:hypothetical protein
MRANRKNASGYGAISAEKAILEVAVCNGSDNKF